MKNLDYGIVYFIGPKDSGHVKVGYTSTLKAEQRLAQLQTGSAESYVVLGTVDGGPIIERAIHELLAPHRVRGEWFEREAALAVLSHLKNDGGGNIERFGMALADTRTRLEQSEWESAPQDDLAARVAADLISDRVHEILALPIGKAIPLRAWLRQQQDRDDPTGDLAKDVKGDAGFPSLGSLEDYLRYITGRMSNPSVTRAVLDAWIECSLAIKALRFKSAAVEP